MCKWWDTHTHTHPPKLNIKKCACTYLTMLVATALWHVNRATRVICKSEFDRKMSQINKDKKIFQVRLQSNISEKCKSNNEIYFTF